MIVAINFLKKCSVPESCLLRRVYNTTFGLCESTYVSVNSKPYNLLSPPTAKSCLGARLCPHKLSWEGWGEVAGLMEVGKLENSTYRANSYSKSLFQYPYRVWNGDRHCCHDDKNFYAFMSFLKNFLFTEFQLIITSNC